MAIYGPTTGFNTPPDPNTGLSQDLGSRYVSKDYLLDVYPNLIPGGFANTAPGLWEWGRNYAGGLGLNDQTHRSSPVQVGALNNWKQISGGNDGFIAIKTNGTLFTWGLNWFYGHLGLGDVNHRSSPVQVGALTNWKLVASGWYHTAAIKNDGTLWMWGANTYGQLGLLDITHRSSPVQVGALTTWRQAGLGLQITAAIKTDGTLWTWGFNNATFGQLGLGDVVHRSSPVQVGALTNWKQVAGGNGWFAAIKTDGTLWTWGYNNNGQLGLSDITHRSSPVQVGALTNWRQVVAAGLTTNAIKTDGTLWTWGHNSYGALGLGDVDHRSSPVQVGALTNWKQVAGGQYINGAIKTDSTLWTWGHNGYGQLGLGDLNHQSSPIQVGALTTWKQVASTTSSVASIKDAYI